MGSARGGKGPVDQLLGDPMVQRVEEPDILAGMRDLGGNPIERSRHAGEVGTVIDDGDQLRSPVVILYPMLLEQMHPHLRAARRRKYRPESQPVPSVTTCA